MSIYYEDKPVHEVVSAFVLDLKSRDAVAFKEAEPHIIGSNFKQDGFLVVAKGVHYAGTNKSGDQHTFFDEPEQGKHFESVEMAVGVGDALSNECGIRVTVVKHVSNKAMSIFSTAWDSEQLEQKPVE